MVERNDQSFSKQTEEIIFRSPIRTFPMLSNFLILFFLSHLNGRYAEPAYRPTRFGLTEYGRSNRELRPSTNAEEYFHLEGNHHHQGLSSASSSDPTASTWPTNERIAASDDSHGYYDPYHPGSHPLQPYNQLGPQFLSLRPPGSSSINSFHGGYQSPPRTNPEIYPADAFDLSTHHVDEPSQDDLPSMTTSGSMSHTDDHQNNFPKFELFKFLEDGSDGHPAHHVLGQGLGDVQTSNRNLPSHIPVQHEQGSHFHDAQTSYEVPSGYSVGQSSGNEQGSYHGNQPGYTPRQETEDRTQNTGNDYLNLPGFTIGDGPNDARVTYGDTGHYHFDEGDITLRALREDRNGPRTLPGYLYWADTRQTGSRKQVKIQRPVPSPNAPEYYFNFFKKGVEFGLKLGAEPSPEFMEFMKTCVNSKACFEPRLIITNLRGHYARDWSLTDQEEVARLKIAKAEVALQLLEDEGEKAIQDIKPIHPPGKNRSSQRLKATADQSTYISNLPWPAGEISTIVMGMGAVFNEHSGTAKSDPIQYLKSLNEFLNKFWQDFHFEEGEITYTGDHRTFLREKGIHRCAPNSKLLVLLLTLQDPNLTTGQVIYYRSWAIFTAWISNHHLDLWIDIFEPGPSPRSKKKKNYKNEFMDFFYSVLFEKDRLEEKNPSSELTSFNHHSHRGDGPTLAKSSIGSAFLNMFSNKKT